MRVPSRANGSSAKSFAAEEGFVSANAVIMLPVLFSLMAALLVLAGLFASALRDHVEVRLVQSEMQRVMEDIAAEVEYADKVEHLYSGRTDYELRIATRRRTSASANDTVRYISFENSGEIIYRKELFRTGNYSSSYTVRSKQPLNGGSTFSYSSISFTCTTLAEGLYLVEVRGRARRAKQDFKLQTAVIKRSPYYDERGIESGL